MSLIVEKITPIICNRLREYGYEYDGRMYPALHQAYLKVSGVIRIRMNLGRGFQGATMPEQDLIRAVEKELDIILPTKEEKGENNGDKEVR